MNIRTEINLKKQGYKNIAGLDEAGRGAWAGPLVGSCLIFNYHFSFNTLVGKELKNINDSKKLSPEKRNFFYNLIVKNFQWSVGVVGPQEIDRLGLAKANMLVWQRAIKKLTTKPDYLLVDYFQNIGINLPTRGIKFGDQKIFCIAAASILAKVYRDKLMIKKNQQYKNYGFDRHKGYGTSYHRQRLSRLGPSSFHRLSFNPVKISQRI